MVFEPLSHSAVDKILDRGLGTLLNPDLTWGDFSEVNLKEMIVHSAAGDGRRSLNLLESIFAYFETHASKPLTLDQVKEALQYTPQRYDKISGYALRHDFCFH